MKTIKIFPFLSAWLLMIFVFLSCQNIVDYNDGYDDGTHSDGPPKIVDVSNVTRDSKISKGSLAQIIIIEGQNLSGVQSILFNDVPANLSEAYILAKEVVLPIPRSLPVETNNLITIVTEKGTSTFPFSVEIPELVVTGLYNEFSLPGDTVEINGNNFDLYQLDTLNAQIKFNGKAIKCLSASQTMISVVLPKDASNNSTITLESPKVLTPIAISYRDVSSLIFNFDNLGDNGVWAGSEYVTEGSLVTDVDRINGPVAINGKFTHYKKKVSAWGWESILCGGFNIPLEVKANPQDYLLKFEINTHTSNPIPGGNFKFQVFSGEKKDWNPAVGGASFNTYGNWKTVTLDLSEYTQIDKIAASGQWNQFYLIYQPTSEVQSDFSMCNFRFAKK